MKSSLVTMVRKVCFKGEVDRKSQRAVRLCLAMKISYTRVMVRRLYRRLSRKVDLADSRFLVQQMFLVFWDEEVW